MIRTFGARPEIRELAQEELLIRDGEIGAVAETFAGDHEMCGRILTVLAPLPKATRLGSISALGSAASSNAAAFTVLASARHDTDGAAAGEAVIAWTDVCVARDAVGPTEVEFLVDELGALGPEYEHRRAAAVAGLAIADKLARICRAQRPRRKSAGCGRRSSDRLGQERSLHKGILPRWDQVAAVLGGDEAALARLELTPESTLPILDPGTPNARRIFDLLEGKHDARLTLNTRLAALRRFAPEGEAMRGLIKSLLRRGGSTAGERLSNKERWPYLMAAEILRGAFRAVRFAAAGD